MKESVNVKDLHSKDRKYLKKHGYFNTIDPFGKDRNEGQDLIGRFSKGGTFETIITGITHEICRRCFKQEISAIVITYQINKFILGPESSMIELLFIAKQVIADFTNGATFKTRLGNDLWEKIKEENSKMKLRHPTVDN